METYLHVNLSHNNLYNPSKGLLSSSLTKLDVSHNKLIFIDFISGLTCLEYLDISHNSIISLSPVNECLNLIILDASSNKLTEVHDLKGLPLISELNLSSNRLADLNSLENHSKLKILKANKNGFKGYWKEKLPTELQNLQTLEIKENKGLTFVSASSQSPSSKNIIINSQDFKIYYPSLKMLATDQGDFKFTAPETGNE